MTPESLPVLSKLDLRVLTNFISTSNIEMLSERTSANSFEAKVRNFLSKRNIHFYDTDTLGRTFDRCYELLIDTYRSEYIYKNELVRNLLQDKYQRTETVIFNEFKVGKSIADTIFLNGIGKVFEIKTELDNPDRLINQLADYKKAFTHVFVVTNEDHLPKYRRIVNDPTIGFMTFSKDMTINQVYDAQCDTSRLCHKTMMKSLRKSEYLGLMMNIFNEVPNVGTTLLFKTCLQWLELIDPVFVHQHFIGILKKRQMIIPDSIDYQNIPHSLTYLCNSLNLKEKQYISLIKRLQRKIK